MYITIKSLILYTYNVWYSSYNFTNYNYFRSHMWWFRSPWQPRQATLERNQPTSVFPRGSGPYWQQTQSTFTTKIPKYCQAHHPIPCPWWWLRWIFYSVKAWSKLKKSNSSFINSLKGKMAHYHPLLKYFAQKYCFEKIWAIITFCDTRTYLRSLSTSNPFFIPPWHHDMASGI